MTFLDGADRNEQEMDLDTAIQLFRLVQNYEEYAKGLLQMLSKVHARDDLDRTKKIVDDKKQDLTDNNPEFNAIMERRKQEVKQKAELNKAIHKAKKAEVEAKAKSARADAMTRVKGAIPYGDDFADRGLDDFVARTKFKTVDPGELERKSQEGLWCPICRQKDTSNNVMNKQPTCMSCMHKLVLESELKKHNRAYRRQWKKYRP